MCHLDHPNVQTLIGVCLDAEVPYLIMPFMERGSLLVYLRKEKGHLLIRDNAEDDDQVYSIKVFNSTARYLQLCMCLCRS